ncbi:MAG: aspartate kinase [Planctomycetota bacterium]
MKFGGTSLGTARDIERVTEIVRGKLEQRPVLVVSAHSGVTDALESLSRTAPGGGIDCEPVTGRHSSLLAELGLQGDLLDSLHIEMQDLLKGMKLVGEASPRAKDQLLSYGERCSARTLAAYLASQGLEAQAVDAFDAGLRSDSNYGRARPLEDDGRIAEYVSGLSALPVITGFIASDERGNITTLGRNGSDFSAALFGKALSADEIQIWTDVDGIMSADPSLVPDARRIESMSFDEASELAYYGGRVLHPAALLPAMERSIPVRVLNTHRPSSPGTLILPEETEDQGAIRSVVYKEGIYLINLVSPRMLQQPGFLARAFTIAAEHEVDVDLVATSEVSITMSTDRSANLEAFAAHLSELGEVTVEGNMALLCVVGQGIARDRGAAAAVLTTLAEADLRVRVISQGAIKVNVAMVIAEADLEPAVAALHARFFS